MIKRVVKETLGRFGYEIHRRGRGGLGAHDLEREALECIGVVRKHTMVSEAALVSLFEQAVFCERQGVPGGFVECGVWKGGSAALMALVNMKHGPSRRIIHLFDAFQEICEPEASVDGARAVAEVSRWSRNPGFSGRLRPLTGFYDRRGGPGTLQENQDLLEGRVGYPVEFLRYHAGWFQETMPRDAGSVGPIAILRLDADWHASTKTCLDRLYDKVVRGGFVIIDDYGAYEGCRKAVDEFLKDRGIPAFLNRVDGDCRYWIKP